MKAEISQEKILIPNISALSQQGHDYQNDKKLNRILDIYFKAKKDFSDLGKSNTVEKFEAARFLRDTAENTLNYLHKRNLMEHHMVPELEEMFNHAKEKATELSGGKKRRFEIHEGPAKRFHYSSYYRGSRWSYRPQ